MTPSTQWFAALVPAACVFSLLSPVSSETAGAEAAGVEREYVVVFDRYVDHARQDVTQAGGTVIDVNQQIGLALVRSTDRHFQDDVRAEAGVRGVMFNQAVGMSRPDMPHMSAPERPTREERRRAAANARAVVQDEDTQEEQTAEFPWPAPTPEPLADRQWDMTMIGATADGAHRQVTGAGVDVGIIDTGIDARHPDIAPNFDYARSRNFATDRPEIDGPCEVPTCVDPPDVDGRGHGTHVAGTIAAARNGFGIAGVAPDAKLINLRAGQDSGYFFLYETVDALVEAGDLGLDVVNMSFYTDPWLYNCDSRDDYVSGEVTDEELEQQRLARQVVGAALEYAHSRGVTLVAASGNEHTDLAAPERVDPFVPGVGSPARTRTVRHDCINLPSEGPHVISVGAVGPTGTKADYSNYGLGSIAVTAPGGWLRDGIGTPDYETPDNLILSSYPQDEAIAQGLADAGGAPIDGFSLRYCDAIGLSCGFYTYLQGTSMAAPHVVGVVALIIQREGSGTPLTGYSLAPDRVAELLAQTSVDQPCPVGGAEDYTDEGRASTWTALCTGGAAVNSLYGEGIVNAAAVSLNPNR
jgi:subtilisin family serine protease